MNSVHLVFGLLLCCPLNAVVHAGLTYVDADVGNGGNTMMSDGKPLVASDRSGDAIWRMRANDAYGSSGTVLEGVGPIPEIKTRLSGLIPGTAYRIHVHFWDPDSDKEHWSIRAGFVSGKLGTFARHAGDVPGAESGVLASNLDYRTPPSVFSSGARSLLADCLGTATADSSGQIEVFVNGIGSAAVNYRTWYDGLSYEAVDDLQSTDTVNSVDSTVHRTQTTNVPPSENLSVTEPGNLSLTNNSPIEIVPDGAWTWFNDERAVVHQGSLFVGYVKGDGQYGVTRHDTATRENHHMVISTNGSRQKDDHNNPSLTVLPDGRLMALYAKHLGGNRFFQRTSRVSAPSSNGDWGPEIVVPQPANNTYNNTYLLSAEGNRIYNFHRCINFNPTISVSDDLGRTWKPPIPFIEVGDKNVRPYPRYCSNRTDRIDLIYTDGHPRDEDNSIYHMFYRNGFFHKSDGTVIDSLANLPLDHQGGQRGTEIYHYSNAAWGAGNGADDWIPGGRGWTWDVHYDKEGNPACVFQVQIGSDSTWQTSRIFYYYARWTGKEWQRHFIAQAGRGIYAGESDYGSGMAIDPDNTNVVYISSNAATPFDLKNIENVPLNTNARFEVYRGVTSDGGKTFTWEAITSKSATDNLRPIVPENHGFDRAVLWLQGNYKSYSNFNCRVMAILKVGRNSDQL